MELIRRWYDYWRERPGTGTRVSSGGVKIIFSDTNTHNRCAENYRTSGVTDAMRIPKDAYYVHQAMWDGWVECEQPHTYIIGHWNYADSITKPVYIVATSDDVELLLNGRSLGKGKRQYEYLFVFEDVAFEPGELTAIGRNELGKEESRYTIETVGEPDHLVLTPIINPMGFHADESDLALLQFEVVDRQGRRCPLENREVSFTISGEVEWRGGIAQGPDNYILKTTIPVECGINRALIRSTTTPGEIHITAKAEGLPEASLTLNTIAVNVTDGLSEYNPSSKLACRLDRGPTPEGPSYEEKRQMVPIIAVTAGANQESATLSYDDNELSEWTNDGKLETAWITYQLERPAVIKDVCVKLTGWRNRNYALEVLAGDKVVWSGNTPKTLGYVHLETSDEVESDTYTIRLKGATSEGGSNFTIFTELAGGPASELDTRTDGDNSLRIIEIEFIEDI